jgi:hypothetical protein
VQGYPLAGLRFLRGCYCGGTNVYNLGRADNCNQRCPGDADSYCGGDLALSVYKTLGDYGRS